MVASWHCCERYTSIRIAIFLRLPRQESLNLAVYVEDLFDQELTEYRVKARNFTALHGRDGSVWITRSDNTLSHWIQP